MKVVLWVIESKKDEVPIYRARFRLASVYCQLMKVKPLKLQALYQYGLRHTSFVSGVLILQIVMPLLIGLVKLIVMGLRIPS